MTRIAYCFLLWSATMQVVAQIPAIPEPPIILHGTATNKTNGLPVTITSVTWQVTDGTTNRNYSAASLPATRVLSNGQSFYLLEVPHETRVVKDGAGQIMLDPGHNGFEPRSPAPTYTLNATINGVPATIKAVDGITQPEGTTGASISDYTPATQGRMMRVDLWIGSQDPYLTWAAGYFANPYTPEAAPGYDFDHDGFTNDQERLAGTDPTNGTSALHLTNISRATINGTVNLTWASVPGKTYQVQTSQSLLSTHWSPLGDPVTAIASTTSMTLPTGANENRRFFRVMVLP